MEIEEYSVMGILWEFLSFYVMIFASKSVNKKTRWVSLCKVLLYLRHVLNSYALICGRAEELNNTNTGTAAPLSYILWLVNIQKIQRETLGLFLANFLLWDKLQLAACRKYLCQAEQCCEIAVSQQKDN